MRRLRLVEVERDNVRAALRWAIASRQVEIGLQVAAGLSTACYVWGLYAECRQWLADLMDTPGSTRLPSAAVALGSAGGLAFYQDDYTTARTLLEDSRAHWMAQTNRDRLPDTLNSLSMTTLRLGDRLGARRLLEEAHALELASDLRFSQAMTLGNFATLAYADKNYADATRLLEGSCAVWRGIENQWGLALGLTGLGFVAHARGDLTAARGLFQESLAVLRDMDAHPQVARALAGLGRVALSEGDLRAARRQFETSLRLLRDSGQRLGVARCLLALAAVAAADHQPEQAMRLVGAARAVRRTLGMSSADGSSGMLEASIDAARRQVGTRAAVALMAEGESMGVDRALAWKGSDEQPGRAAPAPLTPRESQVALLLAEGLSNRQIAERLVIAEKTAALHVEHILGKLGLHSRWQAADWARQHAELMGTSIP